MHMELTINQQLKNFPSGLVALIGAFASINRGLVKLDLGHTRVTGKYLNKALENLSQNQSVYTSLQTLSVAGNPTKGEDLQVCASL